MLWVTCEDRLCSTKGRTLTPHQRTILHEIAEEVFDSELEQNEVAYKKEVAFGLQHGTRTTADFILATTKGAAPRRGMGPNRVIVEMQGGGSTSNTGSMTRHVDNWETDVNRTNEGLRDEIKGVGSIENDSWKRQLDQIQTKGSIAERTGYGFVLCVGSLFFNYIKKRMPAITDEDQRTGGWDFVLLPVKEKNNEGDQIVLCMDTENVIYTKYRDFASMLANQGESQLEQFRGMFTTLDNNAVRLD